MYFEAKLKAFSHKGLLRWQQNTCVVLAVLANALASVQRRKDNAENWDRFPMPVEKATRVVQGKAASLGVKRP